MDPVWSKYSCGFALVVFQEPSEPLTALNQAIMLAWEGRPREKQDIVLPLMIALLMIMVYILIKHMPQRVLAEQH